jgi:hypothetical protein
MRSILIFLFTICLSSLLFSQNFKLEYWTIGLGSNQSWSQDDKEHCSNGLKISIRDTLVSYSHCVKTDSFYIETEFFGDTVWHRERKLFEKSISRATVNQIIETVDTLLGYSIYKSDPFTKSGSIRIVYLEFDSKCMQISVVNDHHKIYKSVVDLVFNELFGNTQMNYTITSGRLEPRIEKCTGPKMFWKD